LNKNETVKQYIRKKTYKPTYCLRVLG